MGIVKSSGGSRSKDASGEAQWWARAGFLRCGCSCAAYRLEASGWVGLAEAQQLTEAGYGEALAQRRKRDRAGLCFARTSKASVHESKAEVGSAPPCANA